jgi:hypothetical protein
VNKEENQILVAFKINNIIHTHQFQSIVKAKLLHNPKIKEEVNHQLIDKPLQTTYSTRTNNNLELLHNQPPPLTSNQVAPPPTL